MAPKGKSTFANTASSAERSQTALHHVPPFDPLARENIGTILAIEFVEQPLLPLPPAERFVGAGVYALYYLGCDQRYKRLARLNNGKPIFPVYVGDALREYAKQGFSPSSSSQARIFSRLRDHTKSISQTKLDVADFRCRYLVLEDAFIALAESVLISVFRPPWNGLGFGSRVVGGPRMSGKGSQWDALHPGRQGRPPANDEQAIAAENKLQELLVALSESITNEMIARMRDRVRRFV